MEISILTSVKKVLGLAEDYTVFDEDILMHINSTFSVLHQLGVGPTNGFSIEDKNDNWDTFIVPEYQRNLVKSYIYVKVKSLFDPPQNSYLVEAVNRQITEYEWRLSVNRENDLV